MRTQLWWIALIVTALGASHAEAHFLFVRLLPPAEGGRFAEVFFSDHADAGDPRFVEKIAGTKLWLQTKPGAFESLTIQKTADRLRVHVTAMGGCGIVGEGTYGVLGRAGKPAFLLRHYPKAVGGNATEIAALAAKPGIPFEILVRPDGQNLEFTALRDGKPLANARFTAIGVDLKDHPFQADSEGKARWRPIGRGTFAVYTSQTLPERGVHDGKKYDEIREFATVAFAWPLASGNADPEALALFEEAMSTRASWKGFPGFTADIRAAVDGRRWSGKATVSAKGDVELTMEDESVTPWVQDQLESLVMHRFARPASGKAPVVRFGDEDRDHPLGRLVLFEGGKFASSYRIKEKQLAVVNRNLGKTNMTITVLDNDKNKEGQYLPRSYTVQYWNAASGALQRSETVQDRWTRLGSWDLPVSHQMLTASGSGQSVKMFTLSNHRLLETK